MSVICKKIQKIIGPLIYLRNNHEIQYGEIVKIYMDDGVVKQGQVVKMNENIIVIEVFGSMSGLSTTNAKILFTEDTFKVKISEHMIGKTFNSLGKPIDIKSKKILTSDIISDIELDINSTPINPTGRDYPSDVIQTGISVIDGLFTLIRGQKLPIFSSQGMPHNRLAAQIATQSQVLTGEPFVIIFCGIGIIQDEAMYFINQFKKSGKMQKIISFINFADDPIMERLIIPRLALTTAEYFAFEKEFHVLVILTDMTNYAEALRELSSAKGEVPCRKGYPGYLYSDFASLYERTGKIKDKRGTITQIPILTMPNNDISHPIPDTTGYITEGQLVLNQNLNKKGVYPPFEILASISRLMKDAIGIYTTREDHADVSSHLISLYSKALEIRNLISIVGEDALNPDQKALINFGVDFETKFLNQGIEENRKFSQTLKIAWEILSKLSKNQLYRIHSKFIDKYYIE